jgi:hypothetical protein
LIDGAEALGEKFAATDLVRSTWSAAIQHGAPVSALLVRALERCEARDDTRLSRVMIDLLGGVPAEGDLWVRSRIERSGKQIELVSAETLAPGRDGDRRPVAKASEWRLKTIDATEVVHAPAPPLSPVADAKSRDLKKDWDRNYVHSLDWRWLTKPMSEGPGESWIRPLFDESGAVGAIQQSVLVRPVPRSPK